ncbi:butyrate kinase [Draconibacterium orientale]|jgi:butyrate kinase|uniref:Probable butyrate kinase n=1 Tax=Draconibacterium orientale TaxID=1168034 RepID=X5DKV8_9BACT|nr:butyrate kinase [Draconibacterium orientale]AHW61197.1 butyrate kinase [Draconibacterium orientale]SET36834.1 butyrate kinase [Draconibacterium orientale]
MHQVLAINPGSTSTKFAVYNEKECVFSKTIRHPLEQLLRYKNIVDQFAFRKGLIIEALVEEGIEVDAIKYIIGRGGLTYPLESGVYRVNNLMLEHLREGIMGHHASNLGGMLADYIALQIPNAKAFIADPVVTDEMDEVARFSGHPRFQRQSIFHALNQKATARFHAKKMAKNYTEMRLIIAHLGGGISVGAHKNGRVVDVNNGLDGEGAFSPERSGTLPVGQLIDLCFNGKLSQEQIRRMVVGEGGYVAYLGTNDALEVEKRVEKGDEKAKLVQEALFYQVAKMIGEMAVVLEGKVDGILLTGGLAYDKQLETYIRNRTAFISEVFVYPGEDELEALAMNAFRVANGEIEAREYNPVIK